MQQMSHVLSGSPCIAIRRILSSAFICMPTPRSVPYSNTCLFSQCLRRKNTWCWALLTKHVYLRTLCSPSTFRTSIPFELTSRETSLDEHRRTSAVEVGHQRTVSFSQTVQSQLCQIDLTGSWDDVYKEEVVNFAELGDEGEIWFGPESVEKMVDWTIEHVPLASSPSILEIGSGNGTLLFALAEAGYQAEKLAGIDYSQGAITLSRSIASTRGAERISFNASDFLSDDPPLLPGMQGQGEWDAVMDKGTFDAIALGTKGADGRSPADKYPGRVAPLLKPGGHFLITSCNFTEEELKAKFVTPETGLVYHSRIQHATFTFGGKSGSICSSVAFQKPLS